MVLHFICVQLLGDVHFQDLKNNKWYYEIITVKPLKSRSTGLWLSNEVCVTILRWTLVNFVVNYILTSCWQPHPENYAVFNLENIGCRSDMDRQNNVSHSWDGGVISKILKTSSIWTQMNKLYISKSLWLAGVRGNVTPVCYTGHKQVMTWVQCFYNANASLPICEKIVQHKVYMFFWKKVVKVFHMSTFYLRLIPLRWPVPSVTDWGQEV